MVLALPGIASLAWLTMGCVTLVNVTWFAGHYWGEIFPVLKGVIQ